MLSAALHLHSVHKFNRIIQAEFEHHLRHKALKRLKFSVFPPSGIKSMRDWAPNTIIYPDYQIETVHLLHFCGIDLPPPTSVIVPSQRHHVYLFSSGLRHFVPLVYDRFRLSVSTLSRR